MFETAFSSRRRGEGLPGLFFFFRFLFRLLDRRRRRQRQRRAGLGVLNHDGPLSALVLLIGRGPFLLGQKLQQCGIGGAVFAAHRPLQGFDAVEIGRIKLSDSARLLVGGIVFRLGNQLAALFFLGGLDQFVAVAGLFENESDDLDSVLFFQGGTALVDVTRL